MSASKPHKHNIAERYGLPREVKYCKRCTVSNQRPRIRFDEHGVCSACRFAEQKRQVDWDTREAELVETLDRFRRNDGSYDVVVPVSGGKDGGFVAHQLKYRYGMNPLTVTWAPHLHTDIGRQNLERFTDAGFDNVFGRPNGRIHRLMTQLSFRHIGDPFQPFIYGQTNFPLRMAVQHGISLIMYGEDGEAEYGGDTGFRKTRQIADHDRHYFSGLPPEAMQQFGITARDLHAYMPPTMEAIRGNQTEIHFFGYYKCWDPQENFYYCREHTGFQPNPERTEGTYSKYASLDDQLDGFHYYLAYIKFGLGRTTSDTAHEIRDGKITREEGIALIKRYDGEFPQKYWRVFLDYCNITEEEFWDVVNSWRGEHLWVQDNGEWKLARPIWEADEDAETPAEALGA